MVIIIIRYYHLVISAPVGDRALRKMPVTVKLAQSGNSEAIVVLYYFMVLC